MSQDVKRRWEDLQNYLHGVTAEREKLQTNKQGRNTHSYSHQFTLIRCS